MKYFVNLLNDMERQNCNNFKREIFKKKFNVVFYLLQRLVTPNSFWPCQATVVWPLGAVNDAYNLIIKLIRQSKLVISPPADHYLTLYQHQLVD